MLCRVTERQDEGPLDHDQAVTHPLLSKKAVCASATSEELVCRNLMHCIKLAAGLFIRHLPNKVEYQKTGSCLVLCCVANPEGNPDQLISTCSCIWQIRCEVEAGPNLLQVFWGEVL